MVLLSIHNMTIGTGMDLRVILLSMSLLDPTDTFHQVTGNTSSIGESETRPTNYGVNYIIKI